MLLQTYYTYFPLLCKNQGYVQFLENLRENRKKRKQKGKLEGKKK